MNQPSHDPETVVDAYHRAWTGGDVDAAIALLAEDVRCRAPDPQISGRADWRQYLTAFVPRLTGAPEHHRMVSGERVALWYFPQTATTTSTLASELFTVRVGRIVEIDLVFDRLGYRPPDGTAP